MKLISFARAMAPLGLIALSLTAKADTYTVTSTNASDPAGFLQALTNANNHPGPDTIAFNIPGPGPYTIVVVTGNIGMSVLDTVTIDGTTQPGYAGVPLIEFRGSTNGSVQSNRFLTIGADDVVVKGISVSGYSAAFFDLLRSHFQVYSSYLGIRPDGTAGLPGAASAVIGQGNALSNTVVGAPGQGNYIGGTTNFAVALQSGANHRVQGNVFGTDATGVPKLDNFRGVGLLLSCTDSVVGGNGPGEGNKFVCTQNYAISLGSSRNKAAGNWIGLDLSGTSVSLPAVGGTETYGILLTNGTDCQIGDTGVDGRNIINGRSVGIRVMGSTRAKIFNNWVGFDKNGTPLVQNLMAGISVSAPGGNNTPATSNISPIIGGEPNWPNVMGQGGSSITGGISVSAATGAKISSNWIGIAPDGVTPHYVASGLSLNQTVDTLVGGTTFGDRNVFGLGFSDSIISILDTRPVFQGNYIGMNAFGTQVLNHTSGINCTGSTAPVIGGPAAGAGNYIAGGTQKGIVLGTTANPVNDGLIQGNFIGFLPDGTKVATGDSSAVVISGLRNRITQNAMYSPNVIGIDLGDNNRNGNDANDPDTGPNNLQNYPVITTAGKVGTGVRVIGTLNSVANSTYTIDFYASTAVGTQSMGERYLGSSSVTTNSSGNASFSVDLASPVALGERITTTATDATGNTSELSVFAVVANLNVAPVANAGADQSISIPHDGNPATSTATITLDGSGSTDANGDTLSYQWKLGATVVGNTPQITVTKPAGSYTYTLITTDPGGLSSSDDVVVTVLSEPNAAPEANGGGDQSLSVPHDGNSATNTVTANLSGAASDPDGDTITTKWVDEHGATVATSLTASVTLTAGDHTFQFVVTDAYGASTSSTVHVHVGEETNADPSANAGADQSVAVQHDGDPATNTASVTLTGTKSDPDGDTVSGSWKDSDGNPAGSGDTLTVSLTPGSHTFTYTVTDPYGASSSDTVTVTVNPEPNAAPSPVASDTTATVPHDGDPATNTASVVLEGGAVDPDGDPVTFEWIRDGNVVGTSANLAVTLAPGDYYFTLKVTDSYGASSQFAMLLQVIGEENHAPSVDVGAGHSITIPHDGDPNTNTASDTLHAQVTDPEGDVLTYEWKDENGNVLGNGLSVQVSLTPGDHAITFTATDPYGASRSGTVTVHVNPEANASPTVDAGGDQSLAIAHDGDPNTNTVQVTLTAAGSDPDGDDLTYEWYEGATLRGTTGVVGFACTAGNRTFTVKVRDAYGNESTDTVTVHVDAEPNGAPVAIIGPDFTVKTQAGQTTATFDLDGSSSTDPDNDGLTYQWSLGGQPAGSTAHLSATQPVGTYVYTLEVTDPYGAKSTKTVTVTVELGNQPPVSVAGSNQTVTVQHDGNPSTKTAAVTLNGSASSDPDGQALTYEWKDGNGNVVGTSANVSLSLQAGSYAFTLKVTDPFGASSSSTVSVTVLSEPNLGPSVTASAGQIVPAGSNGTATVSVSATSTDPDGDALSLKWYEGAALLGSGSSLTTTLSAGSHTLTVVATDPYGLTASSTVVVSVQYAGTFFLQPINNDNSSIFKQGSTVPVKFSLSSGATNVVARIYIAKVTNDIVGTEMEPISTSAADTGNLFRYSGGIYIFNLNTKNLTSGTYQVRADLGDGALHTVLISLKP